MKNTNFDKNHPVSSRGYRALAGALLAAVSSMSYGADIPVLSSTPIANTTSVQVKPNVMLLMDTSNSMKFSHMPDEIEVGAHRPLPGGDFEIGYKSYQCNILYYKPTQVYTLPKDSTGASLPLPAFNAAYYNAYAEYTESPLVVPSTVVDLTTSFRAYDATTRQYPTSVDPAQSAYYYVFTSSTGATPETLNYASWPCTDVDTGTFATTTIATTNPLNGAQTGTWTRVLVSSLAASDRQNFAIWYSYYRTRIAMIKSAVSLSFTPLTDSVRVGLITVKPYAALVPTVGASVDSAYYLPINDFATTHRRDWYAKLFSQVPGGSSPAREGLARVGRHYAGKQDSINLGMTGDPVQYSCQQNFTIMTTDGYWNTAAETRGPVALDGTTLVGQRDGWLNEVKAKPGSVPSETFNITPRPIWDGYPDTRRVKTEKLLEYTLEDCTSLYGPASTIQNLQSTTQNLQSTAQTTQSTIQNLQSTAQNLQSTVQNLESTAQNRESTVQNLESTAQNLRSTVQNLESTAQNLQSTTQNRESTTQNLRSTVQNLESTAQNLESTTQTLRSTNQNLRSTVQNLQNTSQILQTTSQNTQRTEQITQSTTQNLQSTVQNRESTTQNLQSTLQNRESTNQNLESTTQNRESTTQNLQSTLQNRESTTQNLRSTVQNLESTAQNLQSTLQNRESTTQNLRSTEQKLESTAQNLQSTLQNRESTTQNLQSTTQNLYRELTIRRTSVQWFQYDSSTELSTPVQTCTPGGNISCQLYVNGALVPSNTPQPYASVPVASCTAQTASSGNAWLGISCTNVYTPSATYTPIQNCTAMPPTAPNYKAIQCDTNNTTNVPVQTCTAAAASSGNSWTTTTCSTNNTTNVPVASCTPQTAAAGNSWVTRTCPAPVTTGPTAVETCTAAAAASGNSWTATTCSTNNTTNVPVASCTPQTAAAGNNWVTRTCPAPVTTTNVPVQTCTAAAASSGNSWTTTTCSTNNTTNVPVASCTPQTAAAGNNWVTRTCSPVSTGPTPVQTCTAVAAAAGNSWTATTCSTNNATNTPVASCTPQTAAAGNNWVTRTCPAPVTTTNVPVQTCTAATAAAGNSWTTTTCSTNNTTNVPVASCTPQTAAAGNNWVTRTCPAPITTGPTAVQTCTAVAAAAGNSWTATTCSTNNTTNVPVQTCTPQTAAAGNAWVTRTCSTNNTTNVPVQTCTPQTAAAGNNWVTRTCPAPIVTTNVPVATCTAQTAAAGNNWVTRTCSPVSTGPTPVQTCTAVTAAAGNSWTATTCSTNNTTNVPVASCTPQTAAAGNNWVTRTCPAPVTTTNVPVQTCTAAAAAAGNSWTTTTCSTNNTTNVPVASCTPQTAAAGNSWVTRTCTGPTILSGPTVVQTCTAVAASAGNGYVATVCGVITNTVPVQTCTPQTPNAGNNWTTITCANNNTTNVPVATCTPQTAAAGNNWTTITCPAPNVTTNVPVATCTPAAANAGNNWTTTTCPAPVTTGPTPVQTCTAAAAAAGNSYTTTTCTPNNTTNVPVQTCTPQTAAAGNNWVTRTCSTNNTTNVPVASCTPQTAAAGNNWVTRTCPAPVTTTNVPVQTCTAAAASGANSWTTTTCSTNNTTNVPVASCTPQTAAAGNNWVTRTCPAPVTTGPTPVQTCTAVAAAAGNSWTATTCSTNNTTNVPVASCTPQTAAAGNNWVTRTCPAPVTTTNVPVQTCTAAAASGANSWTTTTCSTNNTTNVPVASCTAQTAAAGNNWVTRTCPAPVVTTNVPVSSCTPQTAAAGNNWVTRTCSPLVTTNVPVSSCTPQTAAAGNNWVTRTCPPAVTTTNVAVQTCTAAAASGANSWTTTTCSTNNTTDVPVASCSTQTAAAGNSWVTITCPAPVTTGPTGVATCTPVAASAGNNWTATTCAPNNTTDVPVQTCTAEAAAAGNNWTTTTCSTNNTTNVPVASCTASAAAAGNAWVTTTCPPPVTTATPEMYNCVAVAASAANNWTETLCGPRLPGQEEKSRVGTRTTTDILSNTTLISSTVSALSYNPPSGYSVTDGICTPLASTLVPPRTQTPNGPATTTQISPPAVPANIPGPPATNYVQTCEGSGASWPCTLDEIKDVGSYNSLADVAQYYYVTDLRNAADGWPASSWDSTVVGGVLQYRNDNVPASGSGNEDDRVNWQHMTTYTIGLGVSGTVAYDKNYKNIPEEGSTNDFHDIRTGTKAWPVWPDPTLNYAADGQLYSNPKSIDDFWHTAVNGRGKYFSAGNPSDVIDGLRDVLRDLGKKQGSGAAAASSSQTPVQGNNIAFIGKYATTSWSGDIEAREIDLTTGAVKSTVLWSAATKLDQRAGLYCDDRKIMLFRSGATNNLVDFKWNSGTCTTVTVPESTTQTITVAGTVTSVSLDTVTYPDPNNPPTATAQTGALVPRALKVGDAILANDSVVTSAGAVVKIEQVTGATTTLNASEQAAFGAAKIALLSQYPDMSDGTSGTPNQRAAADDDTLVNFLRGQRGREGFVAKDLVKLYRKRESVLGDLVNAQPVFVQAPFAAYSDTGYQTFKTDNASRKSMIYAAANDGMLHAFYGGVVSVDVNGVTTIDATGGREAWAFIPSAVLGDLYKLADFDYSNRHTFLVDGTPTVGDVYDTTATAWKTVLVAGLNKGGKAYYALDVTDPDNPKALWEFKWSSTCYSKLDPLTHGADCHLGYSFGKPIITKMKNGQWVALVTSGYSNHEDGDAAGRGKGYLYVLDVITGKIISKIDTGAGDSTTPSGLAQITNYVDNALINNTTKYVYGGDNDGNVWRFDIYDDQSTAFDEASATLIGIAKDSSGRVQPITTRPELGEIAGKPWIFVGTGRLLGLPDLTDVYTQSVYGFVDITANGGSYTADYPDPTDSGGLRDELRQLTLTPKTDPLLSPASGATRTISCSGGTCARKSGWVIDLIDDGERVNVDMSLTLGTLIFASNVPRNTACTIGGYSWLNFVDYRTGLKVEGATVVSASLGDTLAVGLSVMRLPSSTPGGQGKTVAVVMGSSGVPVTAEPPVNVPPPIGRRVSWREITQ